MTPLFTPLPAPEMEAFLSLMASPVPVGSALALFVSRPDALMPRPLLGFSKPPLWSAAASRGPAALVELALLGCKFIPTEGVGLPHLCASQGWPNSFAWSVIHAPSRLPRDPGKAWSLCAQLVDKLVDGATPRRRASALPTTPDMDAARASRDAMAAAIGPPPSTLLLKLCRQGRFGALLLLLGAKPLDARLAQRLADARPLGGVGGIYRSLALDNGSLARELAARAGALLAPFHPRIDLSLDAESLDPCSCSFSIGAGALPSRASRPPLAALCESAARSFSPSNNGWLLLQSLASRGAAPSDPPEAACARMLLDAGCSVFERLPGRPGAIGLCRQSVARHRRAAASPALRQKISKLGGMLSWVAKQLDPGATRVLDDSRSPMEPLAVLMQAHAERESLAAALSLDPRPRRPLRRL